MRLRTSAAFGCLLAALTITPASAAETKIGEPVRLTAVPEISRTFDGPTAAIDPTDARRVFVAGANLQADRCTIVRSLDGGRTFEALAGPHFGRLTDCGFNKGGIPKNMRMRLVFDPDGVLFWAVGAADPAAMGARSIVLARSEDQGDTWTTTVVARAPVPAQPQDAVGNFLPDIFVSPFGKAPRTVWVSWRRSFTREASRSTEGWAAVSTDGGRTFQPEVRALTADPGFDAPRVVADAAGTAYWFQRERPPRPAQGEPPKDSKLLMATSTDNGRTWKPGEVGVAHRVMEEPLAAVSPDGKTLYLAWADASKGDVDVYFARSTDSGATWSEPLRVNDDPVGNKRSQKWPKMSVSPGGRIDLVWYDYRHDSKDVPDSDIEFFLGDANDVYYAYSNDGGKTFSENIRVTSRSIDRTLGTYNRQYFVEVPPAVGSANGAAFIAWSDTRLANLNTQAQDLFGTTVRVEEGTDTTNVVLLTGAAVLSVIGAGLLAGALLRRRRVSPS